jgi:mevalonate kinase
MKNSGYFYAKIMLFGEYGVILGSQVLSIPYTHFIGELSFLDDDKYTDLSYAAESNANLHKYLNHLKHNQQTANFAELLDLDRMESDIAKGIYFESSIPQGYGIGSSGALVAALYQKYARNPILSHSRASTAEIMQLKELFSSLESYFHGKSSGLDPLNSYLQFPLHMIDQQTINLVGIPRHKFEGPGAIFLIDTGMIGKTATYVESFLERCKQADFSDAVRNTYIPLTNQCISDLISGNMASFFSNLKLLSMFQARQFQPMIPENFRALWDKGIETSDYYLKLCGSGGGGFILGFTRDFEKAASSLKTFGLDLIPVYKNEEKK